MFKVFKIALEIKPTVNKETKIINGKILWKLNNKTDTNPRINHNDKLTKKNLKITSIEFNASILWINLDISNKEDDIVAQNKLNNAKTIILDCMIVVFVIRNGS